MSLTCKTLLLSSHTRSAPGRLGTGIQKSGPLALRTSARTCWILAQWNNLSTIRQVSNTLSSKRPVRLRCTLRIMQSTSARMWLRCARLPTRTNASGPLTANRTKLIRSTKRGEAGLFSIAQACLDETVSAHRTRADPRLSQYTTTQNGATSSLLRQQVSPRYSPDTST